MRQPGQWVPVSKFESGERPTNRVPAEARLDVGVLRHVNRIIVVNEGMTAKRRIENKGGNHQNSAECDDLPGGCSKSFRRWRSSRRRLRLRLDLHLGLLTHP